MKKLMTVLSVLALSASFVMAAEVAKDEKKADKKNTATPEERFKKLDSNADGKISMEEWNASPMAKKDATKAAEQFTKKDKDGDKNLSMEEFSMKKKDK